MFIRKEDVCDIHKKEHRFYNLSQPFLNHPYHLLNVRSSTSYLAAKTQELIREEGEDNIPVHRMILTIKLENPCETCWYNAYQRRHSILYFSFPTEE